MYLHENTLFDLDLGDKVTQDVTQYTLHHVTYSDTKFEVAYLTVNEEMQLQVDTFFDPNPRGQKECSTWLPIFCLQTPLTLGVIRSKFNFFITMNVAYQIKGNQECSNMNANILPAKLPHPTTDPWVNRSKVNFFNTWSSCITKLKGISKCSNMVAKIVRRPASPHDPRRWYQKVKVQLFTIDVILHIKLKRIANAATW